jgi:hypothetical protein
MFFVGAWKIHVERNSKLHYNDRQRKNGSLCLKGINMDSIGSVCTKEQNNEEFTCACRECEEKEKKK